MELTTEDNKDIRLLKLGRAKPNYYLDNALLVDIYYQIKLQLYNFYFSFQH